MVFRAPAGWRGEECLVENGSEKAADGTRGSQPASQRGDRLYRHDHQKGRTCGLHVASLACATPSATRVCALRRSLVGVLCWPLAGVMRRPAYSLAAPIRASMGSIAAATASRAIASSARAWCRHSFGTRLGAGLGVMLGVVGVRVCAWKKGLTKARESSDPAAPAAAAVCRVLQGWATGGNKGRCVVSCWLVRCSVMVVGRQPAHTRS